MWDFEEPTYDQPEGNGHGEARKPIEWAVFAPSLNDRSRLSASKRYIVYRPFLPLINSHHACDSRDLSLLSLSSPFLCHLVIFCSPLLEPFFLTDVIMNCFVSGWEGSLEFLSEMYRLTSLSYCFVLCLSNATGTSLKCRLKFVRTCRFGINRLPAHCLEHFWSSVDVMTIDR